MTTLPVLAVGSDRNWRARLERILSGRGEVTWLGSRGPGEPGRGPLPSLLLLDGDDPRVERELQRLHVPMPQRLYFFVRPDVASLRDCVNAGAAGCLDKEASPETVLRAIRSVGSGLFAVDPALLMLAMAGVPEEREPAAPESPPGNWSQLTERQREIVRWAAQGLSNKQIARHLGISPETVKSHLHHVFERAGVSGRMALLAMRWAESEAEHEHEAEASRDGEGNGSGGSAPGSNGAAGGSGRRDVA
ncbi:DNA-binding NarL/FixJ family response regulator [Lysobacter niastensis]|uniref:DNA-binding NarL/FixJ family response regulator n=1 Tax=Lysobacter niastensis TaxID=380629 RepID=A0ABU1W6L6_9GAMM|nr:response regulator transcription factor [Lysobacter niastensis]MDR7133243.1 DNA-binding NarL/FixJ family response regulator [Lysobacter niastensis]